MKAADDEKPRPDGPLMVRPIPLRLSSAVERLIRWIVGRKRAQPDWREKLVAHRCERLLPVGLVDRYTGQRECPQLIGPELSVGVVSVVCIGQEALILKPELILEVIG